MSDHSPHPPSLADRSHDAHRPRLPDQIGSTLVLCGGDAGQQAERGPENQKPVGRHQNITCDWIRSSLALVPSEFSSCRKSA